MKKVAFVASVAVHINSFHIPYLKYFKDSGYETFVLTKDGKQIEYCDQEVTIPFERSPFSKNTFLAYKKLKEVFSKEHFDIIHCHTPVAAMITRLAAISSREKGARVIYTAHGFHFYKGAPLLNWLIYFPIEWICSFFTDTIITINTEDYNIAKKYLKAKDIQYVHGVGINSEKFSLITKTREEMRKELSIPENATVLLSVGELNENKNHKAIIKAIAELKNENLYYIIAGIGPKFKYLFNLAEELNVDKQFKLLGYRTDVPDILNCSDIFCFPSLREGLPVSVMEAMAFGLPVVGSDIRGISDLIIHNEGGFLSSPHNYLKFAKNLNILISDKELQQKFIAYNKEAIKEFSFENVLMEMRKIYEGSGR